MDNVNRKESWLEKHITLHSHDTPKEELANGITHGIGAVFALAGLVFLILKAVDTGNSMKLAGALIYGLSMVLLFSSSSIYHFVKGPVIKRIFRIMDHVSIYFLIAGTYTPIMLEIGGSWGITLLCIIWGMVILGILFTLFFWGRLKPLHVIIYLAMGWIVVFAWKPLIGAVTPEFLKWCLSGGIIYTAGTLVYATKKLPFYHAVWHIFVLFWTWHRYRRYCCTEGI